jgi:hypothetical protein
MLNRMTLMAAAVAALIVASALIVQPGQAQTAAQGAKKDAANECLSGPKGVAPRGSHWFYRLDRANGGRRCWYLGSENSKVRRATAAERRAAAPPPPLAEDEAPPLPRVRTASRSVIPTADASPVDTTPASSANTANATTNTANASASTVDTYSVTAARFSAAWPAASNAAASSEHEGATAAGNGGAGEAATAETQDETPLVWPALAPADAAAAGLPSEPAPGLRHLLLFLAAIVAFIAIAVRAVLKLASAWRERSEPAPIVQRAAPVIRPRSLERLASDHISETAARAGRVLRPLDVATRWDTIARLPRTPGVPLHDDSMGNDAPIYADEQAAPRRHRRVA